MRKFKGTLAAVMLAGTMALSALAPTLPETVNAATTLTNHGTDRTVIVTESMVNNTPDPNYQVDLNKQRDAKEGEYNKFFLKDDLQTVKITVEENNLNYMLQNALAKTQVMTQSVTIGGETVKYAGIKTKGNYTLSATNKSDSDRFSFSINFGKYVKKKQYGVTQNFYGLSKVSFNNFYFDKTMMKEYNALRLMTEMGVPTPQYGLAKLYINDQYYGVYFMVENMDSTIVEQYLNVSSKQVSDYLTKPEYVANHTAELDAYKDSNGQYTAESIAPLLATDEEGKFTSSIRQLWEDDADTLSDVKDMLPTVLTWEEKLTLLSNGKNLQGGTIDVQSKEYIDLLNEVFIDTDEVIKYFATHSFLCQLDNMFAAGPESTPRNYALYVDTDGKAMVIPWDYDLSWGCFVGPNTPETTANWDIDKMYTNDSARFVNGGAAPETFYKSFPLFNVIFQNKTLREKYHTYMEDCSKIVAMGGTTSQGKTYEPVRFAKTMTQIEQKVIAAAGEKLAPNVKYLQDYSQPAYATKGIEALKSIVTLRALGVWMQVHNEDYIASAAGVAGGALGNDAVPGWWAPNNTANGLLAAIKYDSGIISYGEFTKKGSSGLSFTMDSLSTSSEEYANIKKLIGCKGIMNAYWFYQGRKPDDGKYHIVIPIPDNVKKEDMRVFYYSETTNQVKLLGTSMQGNYCKVTLSDTGYLVVADKGTYQLSGASVKLSKSSYVYDGKEKKPAVTVTNANGTVPASQYTVSYSNNKNVGTAKVTITGKGNYSGTLTKTFKITQAQNSIQTGSATRGLSMSTRAQKITLGARAKAGTLTYRSSNGKVKVSKTGVVTIPKNFAGTVKITVTTKGNTNYKAAATTVTIFVPDVTKVTSAKNTAAKKMTVTYKKITGVSGYEICYATNSKFSNCKEVNSTSVKKVISGLKKGQTYYVRVRTYKKISGKTYYSSWSKAQKVKMTK